MILNLSTFFLLKFNLQVSCINYHYVYSNLNILRRFHQLIWKNWLFLVKKTVVLIFFYGFTFKIFNLIYKNYIHILSYKEYNFMNILKFLLSFHFIFLINYVNIYPVLIFNLSILKFPQILFYEIFF